MANRSRGQNSILPILLSCQKKLLRSKENGKRITHFQGTVPL